MVGWFSSPADGSKARTHQPILLFTRYLWEAAKNVLFLVAGPLRGGAKRVHAAKVKGDFPMATKPRGGGAKGLIGWATQKITFFAVPNFNFLVFFSGSNTLQLFFWFVGLFKINMHFYILCLL